MKFINRLKALDQLIRLRITGSPKELSKKFDITERQIYKYIGDLKELGAEIEFDKYNNSYVYTANIKLVIAYKRENEKTVG